MPNGARDLSDLLQEREQWKRELGRAVHQTRSARGQTQDAFADKLGISQPYLSQIENGTRTPSDDVLEALKDLTEGARSGDRSEE